MHTHRSGLLFSVDCNFQSGNCGKGPKADRKRGGSPEPLCHQGVRQDSLRRELPPPPSCKNRSRKETAVIKEGFNYFTEGEESTELQHR